MVRLCPSPCPFSPLPSLYLTCHLTRVSLVSLQYFALLLCILFIMYYRRALYGSGFDVAYNPTDCIRCVTAEVGWADPNTFCI